ncbi:hypothetical protein NQZ79_g1370 [Umbelopsis isabellina]|nr:hypothetical protein NQZ79_g1370 [Umbelopsis isabellina]
MTSDSGTNTLSPCIPIIQITPAPDDSEGYSSDDTLYDSEDQQNWKYEKAVHVRFRPSVPKRTKSAPLPSDDEDSSDDKFINREWHILALDEKPKATQNHRIVPYHNIPKFRRLGLEEAKNKPVTKPIVGPIPNFTKSTTIPYRHHHTQARPIPPPLTHVQPCYAMSYVTYPMYYQTQKNANILLKYANRSK